MLEAVTVSIPQLYLSDPRPWMIGFGGGKDSSLAAFFVSAERPNA